MPSILRKVHSILYPGWSTPERQTTAKNIRTLRKEKGREARGILVKQYHTAVKAARLQKERKVKRDARKASRMGGVSTRVKKDYGVVHKPKSPASPKEHLARVKKFREAGR